LARAIWFRLLRCDTTPELLWTDCAGFGQGMATAVGDSSPKVPARRKLAFQEPSATSLISAVEEEPMLDIPPPHRIEVPGAPPPVRRSVAISPLPPAVPPMSQQSASRPRMMQCRGGATGEIGPQAPCGSEQQQQPQQQWQQPPQQQRADGTDTPPVQMDSATPAMGPSICIAQTVRQSVSLSHRAFPSRNLPEAIGDSTWRPTITRSVHGSYNAPAHRVATLPGTTVSPVVYSSSVSLPAGLPRSRQGSYSTIIPEGFKTEPWGSFVTPLPSPVSDLFPPRDFQFHATAAASAPATAASVAENMMAGDDLPKEEHGSRPGSHPVRPVTSSEDQIMADALGLSQRSLGVVPGSPRDSKVLGLLGEDWGQQLPKQHVRGLALGSPRGSQGDSKIFDQQVQDQGQQLKHVRSLTLDLASTVQELVDMQRNLGRELQEVKLQAALAQQEFRSCAQIRPLQRSGVQPPPLQFAPPCDRSYYSSQLLANRPTNSMASAPPSHCRTRMPQDFQHDVTARNLGYSDNQGLLHSVHGRALEGLGSLHDWTARAVHHVMTGDGGTGSALCCQHGGRRPERQADIVRC